MTLNGKYDENLDNGFFWLKRLWKKIINKHEVEWNTFCTSCYAQETKNDEDNLKPLTQNSPDFNSGLKYIAVYNHDFNPVVVS